jgi:hypothetical protein
MAKGERAYEHYRNTGTIFGMTEGAVRRGSGQPPEAPMTLEQFLGVSRNLSEITQQADDSDPWSDELVRKAMWSNPRIVDKAIEEGWICGLYDFIRDRHKLPRQNDFAKLRQDAAFVRESAAGREELGQFHGGLVKLARMMMERRAKLEGEFKR